MRKPLILMIYKGILYDYGQCSCICKQKIATLKKIANFFILFAPDVVSQDHS